jgi:ketopantoate reductase
VDLIGAGRIGGALHRRAVERGVAGALVRRGEGWEALDAAAGRPIVVCTRNDDLDEVLAKVPERRRADLVFVQNGALRPYLARVGLRDATRGLLFVAVPTRDHDVDPGGESPFCGPHAAAVVDWMRALDVPARAVDGAAFAEVELEKLLWNACFGLLGSVWETPVGAVVARHHDELAMLVDEYLAVGARALGVTVDPVRMLERLEAYSLSIPTFPARAREWPWRNGWFEAEAAAQGVALPVHEALVARLTPGRA